MRHPPLSTAGVVLMLALCDVATVNRVSGRALLDLQTSTDPASQAEQQQAASLSTILEWETELPVSSPPVGAQSAVAPSLQLLAADAPAAPAAEAHALPATAGPKLRGLPSPSLLAEVAAFPASSPPDNTNSSGAAGDAAAAAAAEHDTAPGATAIMVVERASVRTRCRNSSRCREASQAPTNSSRGDAAAGQPHRIDVATNTATQVADLSVPDRCIIAGSALFSSCAAEFNAAQAHLNISVSFLMPQNYTQLLDERGVTQGQVLQYLQAALASPSDSCCAAQCCYNQLLLCDCEPSVVEVVVRFTGADEGFYALLVSQLALSCGIKHFYGPTCPHSIAYPASAAAACSGASTWPPVRDTSPAPGAAPAPQGGTEAAGSGGQPAGGQVAWVQARAGGSGTNEASIECLASSVAEGAANGTGPG